MQQAELQAGMNIILVDDEEIVHQTLGDYLRDAGHQVEDAYDGLYALEILRDRTFDLAVVDIAMPGLDGLSLLGKINEQDPGLPVVMITGHGSMDMVVQALRLGAVDFLTKPVKLVELDALLAKMAACKVRGRLLSQCLLQPQVETTRSEENQEQPSLPEEENELEQRLAETAHANHNELSWHERTHQFTVEYDRARRHHLGALHTFFSDFGPRWRHPTWPVFNRARRQADSLGADYHVWIRAQFKRVISQGGKDLAPEQLQGKQAAQGYMKLSGG